MKLISILLILFLLSGCSSKTENNTATGTENVEIFTERDKSTEYTESECAVIQLNGDSATCSSDGVRISGSTVTVTDGGEYIVEGTLNNGSIVVDAKDTDKPRLIFNGVTVKANDCVPLYIASADKVFITLAKDSENTLSNGGSFNVTDGNSIDGAVFSKQDLTFNGEGTLEISSPAGHGIVCKDDLVFTGGSYKITSASHGIDANDSVRVTDSAFRIDAGKDGIHAENSDDGTLGYITVSSGAFNIEADGDGMSAAAYLQIDDGEFDILSGGGSVNATKESSDDRGGFRDKGFGGRGPGGDMGVRPTASVTATEDADSSTSIKGIKAAGDITIVGGDFRIDSADDAIHSNKSVTVSGGSFEISSGDDGIHADETLCIESGVIGITESYEGLEALDIKVLGGEIDLVASDDGLNAAGGTDASGFGGMRPDKDNFGGGMPHGGEGNGSIVISGGNLDITASGDGIDANGTLKISGGYTVVSGPTRGDTATLDYDVSAVIEGGTFIGTGASGMAQTFSDSKQGVIAINAGNMAANTEINVTDKYGNIIITHTPKLDFAVIIVSCPELEKGRTYTVNAGDVSGEFEAK